MAVTPLERIGKKWWSASSANTWMTQPAAFVLSYVYNVRGSGNHNTARGKAAEVGYEYFMENEFAEIPDAVEEAKKYFARKTALLRGDEKVQKERESIEGFITETIKALEPYGMYTSKQTQLWFDMPGIADPWMGYDDYTFPPQGDDPRPICMDLKTTHRVPSDITDNHKRQIALYQMMRPEHRILICYVSTKKSVVFEMTPDEAILLSEQFKIAAQSFERLVAAVEDPKDMAGFFAPDFSSYHWNDPIVRAEAKRIWGY